MIDSGLLERFTSQFETLSSVVKESNRRILAESPDEFFVNYQNVFVKSYLVSACSTLEAFIQDLASEYVRVMSEKINAINLPKNIVLWEIVNLSDAEKSFKFENFALSKGRKEISDMTSANYHKTLKTFKCIGVSIECPEIKEFKDFVSSMVDKRNKIVHHNYDASDISLNDVLITVDTFKMYIKELYSVVCRSPHLG